MCVQFSGVHSFLLCWGFTVFSAIMSLCFILVRAIFRDMPWFSAAEAKSFPEQFALLLEGKGIYVHSVRVSFLSSRCEVEPPSLVHVSPRAPYP